TLRDAVDGAEILHSIAREWVGPLERAAREAGAAFVETPLVHPGQRFSGDGAAEIARYRRDDAVIGLTEWEAHWYRTRGERWVDRAVVSEDAKAEAYARATVFAMPSRHETFGHTYLEAWSAWRPVIAGDIPPLREVVRDGVDGLIVPQDPAAIARAILA